MHPAPLAHQRHSRRVARAGRHVLRAAVVAALVVSGPSSALAYRTLADESSGGAPPVWASSSVAWDLYVGDLSIADAALLERAAFAGFDAWEEPECSAASDRYMGLSTIPAVPGDGRSTISVVGEGWVERGFPDGRGATTDVRVRRHESGRVEIVEADLYLNFDQHALIDGDGIDLEGVLTHEIGHVLGLAHPCEHGVPGTPECATADELYRTSALYPEHLGASQRHLSSDDQTGICALYPTAATCPATCEPGTHCEAGRCVSDCIGTGCSTCGETTCGRESCGDDAECTTGRCAEFGPAIAMCLPEGATGTSCREPSDCASGLCLLVESGATAARVCTQACELDADCGTGGRCVDAGSARVCAPVRSSPSGCAVGGSIGSSSGNGLLMVWALIWLARRARARVGEGRRESK